MASTIVVNGNPFQIFMHETLLNVVHISHESIESCAWWIMKEYSRNKRELTGFSSISMDDEGLTIVCNDKALAPLELLNPSGMIKSPQKWKSFIINVVGSATEVPGAISYLSNYLTREGMSILHISTYESEVFLVQEQDVEKAFKVFKKVDHPNQVSSFQTKMDQMLRADNIIREGFILQVLHKPVMLAKLSEQSNFSKISSTLVDLLLFDERYSHIEKKLCDNRKSKQVALDEPSTEEERDSSEDLPSFNEGKFMWGLWQCDDEITLLLNDEDYKLFPDSSLIVSPQSWRVIKLAGRPIDFDETGIVNAMSSLEANVSTLNISTAKSNCALVPENQLESAITSLSGSFKCPVHR